MIKTEKCGTYDSNDIYNIILDNENGLTVEIINLGAAIKSIKYAGTDVVLGFDTYEGYLSNKLNFGVVIGRFANRISNAEFKIDNEIYSVSKNEGNNNLHSSDSTTASKVWKINTFDNDKPSVTLSFTSPDGADGFPGSVTINVTYSLTKENSLKIHYEAETDKDTIINLTNHAYFNLNGHKSGNIYNHKLWLNSDFYTPSGTDHIPTGEILSVKNTPYDFTTPKVTKTAIDADVEPIITHNGLDTNFCINGSGYRKSAILTGDISGITMEVYTNQPGVQIYTANSVNKRPDFKDKADYCVHGGICLETQNYPDAINVSHFPSPILRCGEKYDTITEFKFI